MERKGFNINPKKKFEVKSESQRYKDSTLVSEVIPIEQGMIDPQSSGVYLENLIEYPLLEAVKIFVGKGIKTYMSSANQKDVNGSAYIILFYDMLSEENKIIAEKLGDIEIYEYLKEKYLKISVSVNKETTVGELKQKFKTIANTFKSQI
jgi:hypothetical protein